MANVRVVVERGDYLSRIADRYDITIEKLLQLNDIPDPNLLFVGQELLIAEEVPAGIGPQPMGRGITGESVTIVQLRTRLEELNQLGFGVQIGDSISMGGSGYSLFVQDMLERATGGSLGAVQHGGGFGGGAFLGFPAW